MTTPTSAATLAAWPGRHRNAIGTLMVLALLALGGIVLAVLWWAEHQEIREL